MERRRAREGRDEEERTGGEEAKHEMASKRKRADDGDDDGDGIDGDDACVFFSRIALSRVSPYGPASQVRNVGAPQQVVQRR